MELRRRILTEQSTFIPPSYQLYDYLVRSNGNSYIDTGVAGNDNSIKLEFAFMPLNATIYGTLLGNYDGNNQHTCWMLRGGGNTKQINFVANNRKVASSSSLTCDVNSVNNYKIKTIIEYGTCNITCDGIDYSLSPTSDDSDVSTKNIYIGNYATVGTSNYSCRFYSGFKIWKNGKLIRNYMAVVRKLDSKAGYYDTVNHTFNPSIGSADFTAGND